MIYPETLEYLHFINSNANFGSFEKANFWSSRKSISIPTENSVALVFFRGSLLLFSFSTHY